MKVKHVMVSGFVLLLVSCQLFESQVERRERFIVDAVDSCRQLDAQSSKEQKEESMELAQQAIEYVTSITAIDLEEDQLDQLNLFVKYINTDDCDGLNAQLRLGIPTIVRVLREESEQVRLDTVINQVDYIEEFEKAEQKCSDEGGVWVVWREWDAKNFYGQTLRCLESEPPANDPRWRDRLLPYDVSAIYSAKVHKLIGFGRGLVEKEKDLGTFESFNFD